MCHIKEKSEEKKMFFEHLINQFPDHLIRLMFFMEFLEVKKNI